MAPKKAKKAVIRKKRMRSPSSEPTAPQLGSAEVEDRPSSNEQRQPHPSNAEDMECDVDRDSLISEKRLPTRAHLLPRPLFG